MNWTTMPLKTKLILSMVLGLFLVLAVTTAVIISTATSQQEELAYQQSVETTKNMANRFNADMESNLAIARTIAISLEKYNSSDRNEVNQMLENLLEKNPNLIGTYVGFEPNAFDGKDPEYANTFGHDSTGRFVPYWYRRGDNIYLEPLVYYDEQEYYQGPKTLKRDVITEPYFYEGVLMVSYDSPIIKDGEFVGIGGVDVLLNYIDADVSNVRIFETGYLFMVSNGGIIVSHPVRKDWIGYKNLKELENPELIAITSDISEGKGGFVDTIDPVLGENIIVFYEPIETGNYSILLTVPEDEMLAGVVALRNKLITISAIALFLMGVLGYLIAMSITHPIEKIVDDFRHISDDALHGKLDSRADTDVEIDFKEIPVDLNEILDRLKKNSDELRRANEELKSLDKMKDEFLSNVSHELRTPLTLITGYSELLCEGALGGLSEEQIKVQEKVVRNTKRLERLVNSLLYLSKIQAGTVEYSFEALQINAIIEPIFEDLKILADQKEIIMEMNVAEYLHDINGDKDKLTDMITNIVDNAIKFTPKGGKVTITAFQEDKNIHISVKDTGIGIPKDMIDNLFQRFYQLDASRTRKYGGTGLGLYISKTIAEAHSGEVWATSEGEGMGTEMHIRIPIANSNKFIN